MTSTSAGRPADARSAGGRLTGAHREGESLTVLGVTGGHDANWCVVRDGVLLGAFEKERFTGQRHDRGEVMSLIPPTLEFLGLGIDDIDVVATSRPTLRDTGAGLRRMAGADYRRPDEWVHQIVDVFGRVRPCVSVAHHLCHASYARYLSGFDDDVAVLTWDGGGDAFTEEAYSSTTASVWRGDRLDWLERVDNSDFGSLWYTYARAIFHDPEQAGKLMGLAALGTDRLDQAARDLFVRPVQGVFSGASTVKDCWADFDAPPLVPPSTSWEDPVAQDVAHAVQTVTAEAGLSLAQVVRNVTGCRRLALCGGVALNGYLSSLVRAEAGFDDVFVPPAVNDGGLSVGAALFTTHHVLERPSPDDRGENPFLGMSYGPDVAAAALDSTGLVGARLDVEEAEAVAAESIARGEVVGWFEGRAEHGPRALGNRSILAAPGDAAMRDRINGTIKFREPFRPLAPVVPDDAAATYFRIDHPSPWMMYIVDVTERCRSAAPAAVHVDGTARVQTVAPGSRLGRIASQVGERTGTPVILNTSLNVKTPIVNDPAGALAVLASVPLDVLYVDGFLVRRSDAG